MSTQEKCVFLQPTSIPGTLPRPAPPKDALTLSATEPASGVETASEAAPSAAGQPALPEIANGATPVVPTANLHQASPAQFSDLRTATSAESAAAVSKPPSEERGENTGSNPHAEVSKSESKEPVGSSLAASVKPSPVHC